MLELEKLAFAIQKQVSTDGLHETAITGVRLHRFSELTELHAIIYQPALCFIAQGGKELLLHGHPYRFHAADAILVAVSLPMLVRICQASASRPYLSVSVALDASIVAEYLTDQNFPAPPESTELGMGKSPVEPAMLDAVTRLVSLLDTPKHSNALAPLIIKEIVYRTLTGPQGSRLRQVATASAPAYQIAVALNWINTNYTDTMPVKTLSRLAAMSVSAFHMHFKAVTGMTPLQYQKRLRLQEARKLMLTGGHDAAIAAFKVGYESPSQFSREYHRLFGAPPRMDVERTQRRNRSLNQK